MKLPEKMNPMHCASKDNTRYILNGVKILGNLAVATDGRTLCVVKGTRETDDDERDALIPTRVAKAAWPQRKRARGAILPMLMINPQGPEIAGMKGELTTTVLDKEMDKHTARDIDGNYPRFEAVLPDTSKHTLKVGINIKLLTNLAKAMGSDGVVLHFNAEKFQSGSYDEGMLVTATEGERTEAFGVIMPIRPSNLSDLSANHALKAVIAMKEANAQPTTNDTAPTSPVQ